MSYRFVNGPLVKEDINEAIEYYKKINTKLAKQFLFRLREAKAYILNNPEGFQQNINL